MECFHAWVKNLNMMCRKRKTVQPIKFLATGTVFCFQKATVFFVPLFPRPDFDDTPNQQTFEPLCSLLRYVFGTGTNSFVISHSETSHGHRLNFQSAKGSPMSVQIEC